MSRFKFICEYKSDGKVCNIYKDKITGIYYKIDDGAVKRVFSDDVKIADKITNCKIKNRKNKKEIFTLSYFVTIYSLIFIEIVSMLNGRTTINDKKPVVEETALNDSLINLSRKSYLAEAIKQNNTIKDDLINDYIEVLAETEMNESDFIIVAAKFKNYNFKNSEISTSSLNQILNLNDYGFVASELYNYVHKEKNNQKFGTISNIFAGDTDILKRLFDRECLDDLIAEKVGSKVSIAEVLENEDVKKYISKTEEKYKYFSGKLQNNIFNKFICLNIDDKYNSYLYKENGSLKNVTYDYYKFELMKQIYKHENLDYKNEFDRK